MAGIFEVQSFLGNIMAGMFEIQSFLGNVALGLSSVFQFYFILKNATVINQRDTTINYCAYDCCVLTVLGRSCHCCMYCLTGTTKMHQRAFGHCLIDLSCWWCMSGHRSKTKAVKWVRCRHHYILWFIVEYRPLLADGTSRNWRYFPFYGEVDGVNRSDVLIIRQWFNRCKLLYQQKIK